MFLDIWTYQLLQKSFTEINIPHTLVSGLEQTGGGRRKPLLGLGWWVVRGWLLLAPCCLGAFFMLFSLLLLNISISVDWYFSIPISAGGSVKARAPLHNLAPCCLEGCLVFFATSQKSHVYHIDIDILLIFLKFHFQYQYQLVVEAEAPPHNLAPCCLGRLIFVSLAININIDILLIFEEQNWPFCCLAKISWSIYRYFQNSLFNIDIERWVGGKLLVRTYPSVANHNLEQLLCLPEFQNRLVNYIV